VITKCSQLTLLYRLFNSDKELLYVGITNDLVTRMREHRRSKQWFPEVHDIGLELFTTRQEALKAERSAIEKENPAHNIQHKRHLTKPAVRRFAVEDPVREWAAERKAWLQDRLENCVVAGNALSIYDAADSLGLDNRLGQKILRSAGLIHYSKRLGPFVLVKELVDHLEAIVVENDVEVAS